MQVTALHEILDGVERLDVDDRAKQAFRLLVTAIGSSYGAAKLDHSERVAFARRLLSLRISRPTIRDRIIARYGVSRRQAYRIIDAAL